MRPLLLSALTLSLVAAAASASGAEISAKQRELASRYVRAMHMTKMMDDTMEAMKPAMIAQFSGMPGLSPQAKTELTTTVVEVVLETSKEMAAKMEPQMEGIIAETFSEEELIQAVTFYESATGQAIIAKTPQLMAKLMPKMVPMMQEMRLTMVQRLMERLCPGGNCQSLPKQTGS